MAVAKRAFGEKVCREVEEIAQIGRQQMKTSRKCWYSGAVLKGLQAVGV